MSTRKLIQPGDRVALKLSADERKLLVDLATIDAECERIIRAAGDDQPVRLSLGMFDDLLELLAAEIDRADADKKHQRQCDRLASRIETLFERYVEADEPDEGTLAELPCFDNEPGELRFIDAEGTVEDVVFLDSGASAGTFDPNDIPAEFRQKFDELVALIDPFCDEHLNDEYKQICRKLACGLCSEGSPVGRGKVAGWAAGVVYSAGWVNFLNDPSQTPHMRADDIAKRLGVSQATMMSKSKIIREGLDLMPMHPDFCLPSRLDDNPLAWMLMVNGMVMDVRRAPREVQAALFKHGLIPYIPADRAAEAEDKPRAK